MTRIQTTRFMLALSIGAVAAFACVEQSSPVAPVGERATEARGHPPRDSAQRREQLAARRAKYLSPELDSTLRRAEARLTAANRARIEKARHRVAWIGALHRDVMQEADAMIRPVRRLGKHDKSLSCRVILHSMKSAQARMRASGNYADGIWTRADEEQLLASAGCSPAMRMSVLSLNLAEPLPTPQEVEEDTVTGEYRPYLDQLQAAVDATDGSPSAVTSAANSVVANAATNVSSDPDLEVVAGAAAVAISSAEGWNPQTYDYAGDVARKCLEDPYGYGHTDACQHLCSIEYIPADSCNQWEMMLMSSNFWLNWADWSDCAWDLVSHDVGGGTAAGDLKVLELYWAGAKMTARKLLTAFGVGAVGASIGRWIWIMEQ